MFKPPANSVTLPFNNVLIFGYAYGTNHDGKQFSDELVPMNLLVDEVSEIMYGKKFTSEELKRKFFPLDKEPNYKINRIELYIHYVYYDSEQDTKAYYRKFAGKRILYATDKE